MSKFGLIRNFLSLLCLLTVCLIGNKSFSEEPVAEEKPKYYNLVDSNLQPGENEFYLSSVFSINGQPKALISRSKDRRSSEIFMTLLEYGIGDQLTDELVIKDIDTGIRKEVLVYKPSTDEYFSLKISYGEAKSLLTPIPKVELSK